MRTPRSASEITVEWMSSVLAQELSGCKPVSIQVGPDYGGPSLLSQTP